MSEKEVYYHQYCRRCEHYSKSESDDPCDECLAQPVNEDSHKPLYFKQAKNAKNSSKKCGSSRPSSDPCSGGSLTSSSAPCSRSSQS